jgi:hypothetical protein
MTSTSREGGGLKIENSVETEKILPKVVTSDNRQQSNGPNLTLEFQLPTVKEALELAPTWSQHNKLEVPVFAFIVFLQSLVTTKYATST